MQTANWKNVTDAQAFVSRAWLDLLTEPQERVVEMLMAGYELNRQAAEEIYETAEQSWGETITNLDVQPADPNDPIYWS